MDRALIDDITLEYDDTGAGEPVVCIHGAFVADTFRPLLSEPALASRYRLITYHRRGYVGSRAVAGAASLEVQASDCRRLLSHLGVERAHVVGHSIGGAIALRLALDTPQLVHTLTLLEPALVIGESAASYRQELAASVAQYRDAAAEAAVDQFLRLRWPEYREALPPVLPGAFAQAVKDAATCFAADIPAVLDWQFGEAPARGIEQPVLVVRGELSPRLHPRYIETYCLLLDWLPSAEGFVLPGSTHFEPVESPHALAEALAGFFALHPLERP